MNNQIKKEIEEILKEVWEKPKVNDIEWEDFADRIINLIQTHYIPKEEVVKILEGIRLDKLRRYSKGSFLEHREDFNWGYNEALKDLETQKEKAIKKIKG